MTRPYLVLVNGVLAQKTLTLSKARRVAQELTERGYTRVSVAESIDGGK